MKLICLIYFIIYVEMPDISKINACQKGDEEDAL